MIPRAHITTDQAQIFGQGDGMHVPNPGPVFMNDRLLIPAQGISMSVDNCKNVRTDAVQHFISVQLFNRSSGLSFLLTPDGARAFAEGLIEGAGMVDAEIARQAAAAINKARRAGGDA
ncbi:hypothetical protein HT136_01325 [Novosphingobium profundi]|uniref:hypothetical protein n=1 Tax=Novosphingobium profundi TaxID=1774954 RepID=UPI001BDA8536|nr:hypothetical protein [Novosphingobium profundi]MBT0667007.1 hypothetical protein [Novosphingobium profundi]